MRTPPPKNSLLGQPFIPTTPFIPIIRIALAILSIFSGLFFTIGFLFTGLAFIGLIFPYLNIFAYNFFVALITLTIHLASVILYLILTILSFNFAYRLFKKQPISQKQLIVFVTLFIFNIAINWFLPTFFQFIANIINI